MLTRYLYRRSLCIILIFASFVIFASICLSHVLSRRNSSSQMSDDIHQRDNPDPGQESIVTYRVLGHDPTFLEPVPWGLLQENGSHPIHLAHVLGLAHAGVYMAVRDSDGKLLLLQRGTQLKTCAGTWGFLGEHMHTGEDPQTAVKRALDEELGTQIRQHHVASLFNVSTLWYTQVYDDGRSERQATHVWAVQLRHAARDVVLHPDDEVAALRWAPEEEVSKMLENEELAKEKGPGEGKGGVFCSSYIRRLMNVMIATFPPLPRA